MNEQKQVKVAWGWSVHFQYWLRASWHAMSSGAYQCYANPVGRWVWRKYQAALTPDPQNGSAK